MIGNGCLSLVMKTKHQPSHQPFGRGKYQSQLREDYVPYRNHVLRVLSFAHYHLGDAVTPRAIELAALALAYHDIGLWSHSELDYLEPSVEAFVQDLARAIVEHTAAEAAAANEEEETPAKPVDPLTEFMVPLTQSETATIKEIIWEHHKFTTYSSSDEGVDDNLVNAVRKGDWADATVGAVRYGLPASCLEAAYKAVPEAGFHMMLAEMGQRLRPNSFLGGRLAVPDIFRL